MSERLPDGTIVQSGISDASVQQLPESSFPYLLIGTVVGVHHKDEASSLSKLFVEYDVYLWSLKVILQRVHMMSSRRGVTDGDVDILRAGTIARSSDPLDDTDGDIVVIGFLEGETNEPFILGCLSHAKDGDISTPLAEGETRTIRHKGSTFQFKDDGEVFIKSSGGATAVLKADGNVEVFPDAGKEVLLGNSPVEFVALENKLIAFLDAFILLYNTHTHAGGSVPIPDPLFIQLLPTVVGTYGATEVKAK